MLRHLSISEREKILALAAALRFMPVPARLPAIEPSARDVAIPLSFAQQRLWFLAQMEGVSRAYHIPFGMRLKGDLDRVSFRAALDRIMTRHESLRTTFVFVDEQPVQRIASAEESKFVLLEHDLRQRDDLQQELERLTAEEANAPFDLAHGPLIRGRLIRLSEDEHALLITMHHIVSDGWSMGVLFDELSRLYTAFRAGREDPLPELEIQYADYAVWQRKWIQGEILQQQADYWKGTLQGAPALLELSTDHPRPFQQDFAGASIGIVLGEKLTSDLRELSQRHGTTLYMTLLAGWVALLSRLSGQQDIVIGTPTANRGRVEIERLIGFFVNTLVLRLDLSGSPTVSELLAQVREQALAAQQHQDIPFEQVVEIMQPVRSLAHSPLFQVMFAWQNAAEGSLELPGLELMPRWSAPHRVAKFDLAVSLQEAGDRIVGGIEYATALFEPSTIERYLACFRNLLEAMVADDAQAVDRLPMLSEAERRQVLYEWNDTKAEFPTDKCVHELFEEQVEKSPDAVALVFEDDELSYGELNRRANQLAHYLRELGVKPDDRVALCVERGFEMIVALLGVLKAGGAYVPLDPSYPIERLRFMLEDSGPVALLTQAHLGELFAELDGRLPVLDLDAVMPPWLSQPEVNPDPSGIGLTPSHLAYVIYTSGSTGQPKGVMVQHRGVVNRLVWMWSAYGMDSREVIFQKTPFGFDVSVWEFFLPLLIGARLALARPEGHKNPHYLAAAIKQHRVTTMHFVPSMLQAFLDDRRGDCDIFLQARIVCSGEALPIMLARQFHKQFPHATLHNLYGPTEASVDVTAWTSIPDFSLGNPPIGRPIANTQVYILDAWGEPVPVGVPGELYIGGAGVARGYLNRPELTAERFLKDPFVSDPDARMYRTGDLGRYLADGNIEFLGRNDFQVKIRGFRIELGEIEARLMEHAGVREAVVVAREDTPGDKRLAAYYTSAEEQDSLGAEQLRAHLSAILPEYMVPAAYVRLEFLPLTPNGKLDRRALPAPEIDAYTVRGYEPPQGEVETKLAEIWAEVLRLDRVGRHDNFFELGGHSLLAITLIERMRRNGYKVDVRSLFASPTLADLATTIDVAAFVVEVPPNLIPSGSEAITPEMLPLVGLTAGEIEKIVGRVPGGASNVQDIYPLAPLQEGILFHHLMEGEGDPYLLVVQYSFDNRTRLDSYLTALQAVVNRHDILRTAVQWADLREPVQVVWRQASLHVEEIELDPAAGDVAGQLYARFNPRQFRMDVRQAPLLRAFIALDKERDRWLMMLLLHHLVGDHTTLEVLQAEIQAYLLGRGASLPAPLPFRNLVAQARLGISEEEHERFFRQMLGDIDESTAPFGLVDVRGDGSGIEQAHLTLDNHLAWRIRERARKLGVSAASLCHLAWGQVLARVSGRDKVVFGTVLFGRMQGGEGADRVMGPFINTLPLRIDLGEQSAESGVRNTHAQLAALLRHEHASLALAQRCSAVPAPAPLFSALLNYRHSVRASETPSAETMQAWEGIRGLRGEERTNYPFVLSVNDLGQGFSLDAQTVATVGPMRICEYMQTALESLVEALESAPETRLCELNILPAAERRQVLYEWNDTKAEFPTDKCVHELFEEQVEKSPDAVALVFEDDELSYGELNRRANQLAHYLRELGVKPDDRVALCVERGFEMIVALLGVLKAGGAYVPLDPSYPIERLRFMLEDSGPVALLTQAHLGELFAELDGRLPVLDLDAVMPPWLSQPEVNPDPSGIGLTPSHLAYVIYTSGSTGQPKGVMVQHGNLANYVRGARIFLPARPLSSIVSSTLSFDLTNTSFYPPLLQGGSIRLLPPLTQFNIGRFAEELDGHPNHLVKLTPSHLYALVSYCRGNKEGKLIAVVGGESLSRDTVVRWKMLFPQSTIINHYGPTETTVGVCTYLLSTNTPDTIPIGRPIANTQVYILDAWGEPVPVGVPGELYIGGAGVARGYLNRPELTAERFLKDPFVSDPDARMYRTGDLGRYLADGNIEFLGRNDFQVKIRGFRIELGEIEARLMEHAGVREAVVVAREDTPGDKRLAAYYTSAEEQDSLGAEQLRAHLSAILPEYMVPAAYVRLEFLPLTPNGKLDRRALPAPEIDAYTVRGYEPPQGEVETKLAEIWAEVLRLDRVGRHDNFFELGGHSLLAITVIERMRRAGLGLEIRPLFASPTLAALAATAEGPSTDVEVPPNLIPSGSEAITPEMLPLVELTAGEIEKIVGRVPGGASNVQDIYPLAPLQEGILFHHLMEENRDPYVQAVLFHFEGRTRLDSYLTALQAVVNRHDILRTAVQWADLREPVQVVWRQASLHVEEIELDPAAGDVAGQLYARFNPRQFRMDVRQAPLLRAFIALDRERDRWLMMLLQHHLVGDHTTLEVLQAEIQAYLLGRGASLPAPLPFRNLVAQARLGISKEEHERFFRQMLGDIDESTAPFGLVDVRGDGSGIEQAHLTLDNHLAWRIRERARKLGVSAASLCHLAWGQVLARVSGRDKVVFGTVLFGRMQGGEGADRVMGPFINTLPLRIDLGEQSAESGVRNTHAQLAALLRHEHASLALAQRCSAVPAPAPLFSALLNYRHSVRASETPSAETMQAWEGIRGLRGEERTNYPFVLSVNDLGQGFSLDAQTVATVGPMRICEYMQTALESLVEALESAPETRLCELNILPAAERRQVLYEWNDTKAEFPTDKCVHELFEEQVEKSPDAVALVFEDDELSYGELNRRANQLAHYLRELGVKPDDRVALCVERGFEMIVALLGVLKAGGAYVPLDPSYPIERLRFMLEDSGPVALLTQAHLGELFAELDGRLPVLDLDAVMPPWLSQPEVNPDPSGIGLTPSHLAYVIYTSGSTGQPKGVMVEHAGLRNYLLWAIAIYVPTEGSIVSSSLSFDATVTSLFGPLLCRGSLHLLREREEVDGLHVQLCACKDHRLIKLTPGHLDVLGQRMLLEDIHTSVNMLVIGGEALSASTVRLWRQIQPDVRLVNEYGPTETAVGCVVYDLPQKINLTHCIPIGRPIANTQVYILDAWGEPVPVGVPGELYIGGAGVARGYLNRPELTAERFLKDPFVSDPDARMYRTGDLGRYLADGNIEFLGRNDFQVKIRGFRIELGEIEARLMEHAGVREAVVVAREDTPGDKRLAAYYTSAEEQDSLGAEQLRAHLSAILPEYMVPAAYVRLEFLPLTPNGKLDRRALPAPEIDAYTVRGYEPPQGEVETKLAEIWAEVLRLDRVGRHDNFFELGGHSLLAVRVATRLQQAWNVEIGLRDLFAYPELSALARHLEGAVPARLPAIEPSARDVAIPLSFAQQRLWFLDQMEGVSRAYHIPFGMRLKGDLDRVSFRAALDRIMTRHESLRTTFVFVDEQPVQRIASAEESKFVLLEHDLRQRDDLQQELERLTAEEANAPFDLAHGPLIRGRLIRLSEDEHALLITMHHIVSDGWSMGVLFDELSRLYTAFRAGREDPLPELEIQYADYAVWQRKWIQGEILQQQADYWKGTLQGAPALLELSTDHPRPFQQDFAGASIGIVLGEKLTSDLRELSQRHGTTLYMTLLAGWVALLSRLSGQQDIVIGTPTANRGRVEIERLIGFFVNTLVLRLDLSGSPTVSELLAQVREQALAAQQHQDIPFEQVVEIMQPVRSLAHSPLFQVMFAWQNAAEGSLELPGLELRPFSSSAHQTAKFELTLDLSDAGLNIVGGIEYATALFEPSTIERYLACFRNLLEAMVADDAQAVDRLPMLSEAERRQVLYEWNDTKAEFPTDKCVHELFEEQVEKSPDAVALVFEDDELSYGELNRRANQLAHYLRELGVKPDDRVALCVERGFEMIVALLGVLKAGGAYVPLDPSYPIERLRFMLEDSGPVALLTQAHLGELFAELDGRLPVLDLDAVMPPWLSQPEVNPDPSGIGLTPSHLAYVIYTSGSTGQPKGVMVEHAGLRNYLLWAIAIYVPTEGSIVSSSLSFDATVTSLFGPLLCRGSLHLLREREEVDGLHVQLCACKDHRLIKLTPGHLDVLGQRMLLEDIHTSVNMLVIGGEALSASTVRLWRQIQPDVRLVNEYGPTETAVGCVVYDLPQKINLTHCIPIGRPIANTQVYILDAWGEPVPVGVPGELYIGGAGVARGYLNRPELTAERFLKDPFVSDPDARMYRTGDLGRYLADGNIEFLGRNDFQVKIRGFRIELGEIEARLMEHAGVREAVVVAREDTPGDKRLAAYYTSAEEQDSLGAEQLRAHLSAILPEYMVPAAYVRLEFLPLTPNGKLDRRALPAPEIDAYTVRGYEPPQGEVETKLAEIWAEVLRLDRVGRHDNFFELGGHSLLAITVIERMRRAGLDLEIRPLFASPTLAALAATAEGPSTDVEVPPNLIPSGSEAITPEMLPLVELTAGEIEKIVGRVPGGASNVQDIYPLAPLQEGILFHHLMEENRDPYVQAVLFHFEGRTRLDSYLTALQAVVNRHDILRTAVQWADLREPVQVVWRQASLHVEEIELDPAAGDVAGQLYARFNPRQFRMDVRQAPLLRAFIALDRERDRWLMMLLQHHLVGDHTTLEVLQAEIQAYLLGRGASLPAPLPFRNLVAQARLGISEEEHERFFRQMLGDIDESTAPFGLVDVRGDGSGIEQAHLTLDNHLAWRIRERARKLGVSAASLCHLAWGQVLARVSGRDKVVFGTVLFGRMQGGEGADRVMGPFINTLPLRIDLGEQSAESGVRNTHAQLAALLRHEHASLALAQRCSAVPAPAPLFSALLNYRHSVRASETPSAETMQAWEGIRGLRGEERTNYPFVLSVNDLGQGFSLDAQTVATVGPMRICEYMQTALESLVEALESAPETRLCELNILPAAERRQVLYEWNDTKAEFPSDKCVHELFEEQVEKSPDAVALVFEDDELSYGELNRRANQLAHYLRELGVKPDDRVALCVERGFEMIVALLGVLKAGGAYVPLDPSYPIERLRFMLEDSGPVALLTQAHLGELFAELDGRLPVLDLDAVMPPWLSQPEVNPDPSGIGLTPSHLAYVIYTSGSTGQPKGVMVQHRSLLNTLDSTVQQLKLSSVDRTAFVSGQAFDISLWETLTVLTVGGAVAIWKREKVLELCIESNSLENISVLHAVPSLMKEITTAINTHQISTKIRLALTGGDRVPHELIGDVKRAFEEASVRIFYGPTETAILAACFVCNEHEDEYGGNPPIGRPIANTQVYILDAWGEPVPVGVPGELYIGGAGVARGYLNRPELTAERFLKDPFVSDPDARMYRTGDLGRYLADGNIEFLGRNDFQVKIRGFRIELGEIEARLMEHAGVREAVVVAREDTPGDKRLAAYYTSAEEQDSLGAEQLRAHLSAILPEYMVPAAYVRLESLPLTPNGKLDRRALPAPEIDAYTVRGYEPPQGEVETKLAEIWAEVLRLDRVGRHDNFFELGGHSLLAVRVATRLQQALGVDVVIGDLFQRPKLADLAICIANMSPCQSFPITRTKRTQQLLQLITATGPNGHQIASNDSGRTWYDRQTGEIIE